MYDPQNNRLTPIDPSLMGRFNDPSASLTATEKIQREWTRFSEGETVNVKGINFRVHEIGESRLILKPIDKTAFAGK